MTTPKQTTPSTVTSTGNGSTEAEQPNQTTVSVTSDETLNSVVVTQAPKPKFSKAETSGDYEDYKVMPDGVWPPPIFIRKNVTPQERFYLENRWHSQWSYYDSKATENKNTYFFYQRIVVIGALLIPALVSLNSTIARFFAGIFFAGGTGEEALLRIVVDSITVFISLAVAGAAALESLYKYGDNWSSYRAAAEELQSEKSYYDMKAGPYANNASPFTTFVERVENVIAKQNGNYFQALQANIQKQEEFNDSIVQSFLDDDDGDDTPTTNTTVTSAG